MAPHSSKAQHVNLYPDLQSGTLISMGQLCDDQCTSIFNENSAEVIKLTPAENILMDNIIKNSQHILHGKRNKQDGMWYMNLSQQPHQQQSTT
eukprot:15362261-Ditylum_brightwellii.AAC.1